MENQEKVQDVLGDFVKTPSKDIPPLLEEYLRSVAKTGKTVFPWQQLKTLFVQKLEQVMEQFIKEDPCDGQIPFSNIDSSKYEEIRRRIIDALQRFSGAPFTVQRICELVTQPKKHYTQCDKFLRGIEKNIMVVSTVDPFGRKIVSESRSLVNGLDLNGVDGQREDFNDITGEQPFGAGPHVDWTGNNVATVWPVNINTENQSNNNSNTSEENKSGIVNGDKLNKDITQTSDNKDEYSQDEHEASLVVKDSVPSKLNTSTSVSQSDCDNDNKSCDEDDKHTVDSDNVTSDDSEHESIDTSDNVQVDDTKTVDTADKVDSSAKVSTSEEVDNFDKVDSVESGHEDKVDSSDADKVDSEDTTETLETTDKLETDVSDDVREDNKVLNQTEDISQQSENVTDDVPTTGEKHPRDSTDISTDEPSEKRQKMESDDDDDNETKEETNKSTQDIDVDVVTESETSKTSDIEKDDTTEGTTSQGEETRQDDVTEKKEMIDEDREQNNDTLEDNDDVDLNNDSDKIVSERVDNSVTMVKEQDIDNVEQTTDSIVDDTASATSKDITDVVSDDVNDESKTELMDTDSSDMKHEDEISKNITDESEPMEHE